MFYLRATLLQYWTQNSYWDVDPSWIINTNHVILKSPYSVNAAYSNLFTCLLCIDQLRFYTVLYLLYNTNPSFLECFNFIPFQYQYNFLNELLLQNTTIYIDQGTVSSWSICLFFCFFWKNHIGSACCLIHVFIYLDVIFIKWSVHALLAKKVLISYFWILNYTSHVTWHDDLSFIDLFTSYPTSV